MAFGDRGDLKHPLKRPDLDSSGGASGPVGRHRTIPAVEILKRSSFGLNVGTDTSYACLKTPRSSAYNASLPHVPVPSRATCWPATVERSRALFRVPLVPSGTWQPPSTTAAWTSQFRECLCFARARIHPASPVPDLGALHAGDCGIYVLPAQRRATQMVVEERLVTSELPVPFASKRFKCVHVWADFRRKGHVELADKPTEHPGACRTVVRFHGLVLHREMARVQRDTPKGRE